LATQSKTVLEIGIGNGFVSRYLRDCGIRTVTLDLDYRLHPSVAGSLLQLPFRDDAFPTVSCCEVLEHIPFDKVPIALQEIARVSANHVVISVPDVSPYVQWMLKLPFLPYSAKMLSLNRWPFAKAHDFDGEHYWEIGKCGYPLHHFRKMIRDAGLTIASHPRFLGNPYHRFIIASKLSKTPQL
jgi:ubiquinone/menaquinone biosynthesis C-methylase UbiE